MASHIVVECVKIRRRVRERRERRETREREKIDK